MTSQNLTPPTGAARLPGSDPYTTTECRESGVGGLAHRPGHHYLAAGSPNVASEQVGGTSGRRTAGLRPTNQVLESAGVVQTGSGSGGDPSRKADESAPRDIRLVCEGLPSWYRTIARGLAGILQCSAYPVRQDDKFERGSTDSGRRTGRETHESRKAKQEWPIHVEECPS